MRTNKEAAADWRPRRHQMANTQSHFSLRTNANTIETIIQFYGERMGPRENPPAIPNAPLDRTAFAKGRPANRSALPQETIRKSPRDEFDRAWANRSSHVKT